MSEAITKFKGTFRAATRKLAKLAHARQTMLFPTYSAQTANWIEQVNDDVRYSTLALAIARLEKDRIEGAFAELGVYRGVTSAFIHGQTPNRRLYLFDTFEGFPSQALGAVKDLRFRDTSQEEVARTIGNSANLEFRKGYFPATAVGLEGEMFALVMLDFDLYRSALDAFQFFYPRLVRGGFFFMHDFNSPESDHGISRAALEFLSDKPELLIEIPDREGSAVFRKIG